MQFKNKNVNQDIKETFEIIKCISYLLNYANIKNQLSPCIT